MATGLPSDCRRILLMASDPKRDLLRHTLATLAYRGGKAVRGAPPEFGAYRAAETTRTPGQILAHIGDLLALVSLRGKRQRRVVQFPAPALGPGSRPFLRGSGTFRRLFGFGRSAARLRRKAIPGSHSRCAHACGPDRDAPPHGRLCDEGRKLPSRGHRFGARGAGPNPAAPRVRLTVRATYQAPSRSRAAPETRRGPVRRGVRSSNAQSCRPPLDRCASTGL